MTKNDAVERAVEALEYQAYHLHEIKKSGGILSADLAKEAEIYRKKALLALQTSRPDAGCEVCEGTGRIECLPDDGTHTHPCDTCQPEANKEFQRGVEFGALKSGDKGREFPYQKTFNAIGDAVTINKDGSLGISVKAFQDSFNSAPPTSEGV